MGPQTPDWKAAAAEGFAKLKAQNLRRRREHLPRHKDAFMGAEEGTALLLGVWVPVRSSWIVAAMYDAEREQLHVRFGKRGTVEAEGYYPGISFDEAEKFASAPSKGGYLHDSGLMKGGTFVRA